MTLHFCTHDEASAGVDDVLRATRRGVHNVRATFGANGALLALDVRCHPGVTWFVCGDGLVIQMTVFAMKAGEVVRVDAPCEPPTAGMSVVEGTGADVLADPRVRATSGPLARVLEALRLAVQ